MVQFGEDLTEVILESGRPITLNKKLWVTKFYNKKNRMRKLLTAHLKFETESFPWIVAPSFA